LKKRTPPQEIISGNNEKLRTVSGALMKKERKGKESYDYKVIVGQNERPIWSSQLIMTV